MQWVSTPGYSRQAKMLLLLIARRDFRKTSCFCRTMDSDLQCIHLGTLQSLDFPAKPFFLVKQFVHHISCWTHNFLVQSPTIYMEVSISWGYPQSLSISRWDFPWNKPSSYWDTSMTSRKPPHGKWQDGDASFSLLLPPGYSCLAASAAPETLRSWAARIQ